MSECTSNQGSLIENVQKPNDNEEKVPKNPIYSEKMGLVVKMMKSKVQDKLNRRHNSVYTSYLFPEILITEEERQGAIERLALKSRRSSQQQNDPANCLLSDHGGSGRYVCKIENYSLKKQRSMSGELQHLLSNPLQEYDRRLRVQIDLTGPVPHHMSIRTMFSMRDTDGAEAGEEPPPVFRHRRTIMILDRSSPPVSGNGSIAAADKQSIVFVDEPPFGDYWSERWATQCYFEPKFVLHQLLERETYLDQDDTVHIVIVLEPLFPLMRFHVSDHGVLVWRITDYEKNYRNEKDGIIQCVHSGYFYSAPYGYRMRVSLYLNGAGWARGTHLSIFLEFLRGSWDAQLPNDLKAFPHKTTFTLFDQTTGTTALELGKRNITRTDVNTDGSILDLFYDFAFQSHVGEAYVMDDSLLIRVQVEPIQSSS